MRVKIFEKESGITPILKIQNNSSLSIFEKTSLKNLQSTLEPIIIVDTEIISSRFKNADDFFNEALLSIKKRKLLDNFNI